MNIRKFIQENVRNLINEVAQSNVIWYHGSNVAIDQFQNMPSVNRVGNVDGFYFTNNRDVAQRYGSVVTQVNLNVKNPFVMGKSKATEKMVSQYAQELHIEDPDLPIDGGWIQDKCDYLRDNGRMPFTGMDGTAQQRVYLAGDHDGVLDGHEMAVFHVEDIQIHIAGAN